MEESSKERKPRKTRFDKNLILTTERDLRVLPFVADQYAVRIDIMRVLLSRLPGKPLTKELVSDSVLRDQLKRWRRAGWVEYKRFQSGEPGWIWMTKKGLEMLGLEHYTSRSPAVSRLAHYHGVNVAALHLSTRYGWHSEREILAGRARSKKGEILGGPVPDGWIDYAKDHKEYQVAIEVELTLKKPKELATKVRNLAWSGDYLYIWFYVPSLKIQKAVEAARDELDEKYRKLMSVSVSDLVTVRATPQNA